MATNAILETIKKYGFLFLYAIAVIALVYAAFTGNLISFVLGVAIFVWTAILRFKGDFEAQEGDEEVKEENESKTD